MEKNIFEQWDKEFDVNELNEQVKKASENEFKPVEEGTYTVKLNNLEIGATGSKSKKPNSPMLKVDFIITEGKLKKQHIFVNYILVSTSEDGRNYGLYLAQNFLKSLDCVDEEEVIFESFSQFNDLVMDIVEIANTDKLTFKIEYTVRNNFGAVKVIDVLED